jgi:hypothetical protein
MSAQATAHLPVYRVRVTLSFSVTPCDDEAAADFNPAAYARELLREGTPLASLSDTGLPAARIEAFDVAEAAA